MSTEKTTAEDLDPHCIAYHLKAGALAYKKGDLGVAKEHYEFILQQGYSYADVYNTLGVIYHAAGLFSQAKEALAQALSINPNYTEAALNLAILHNDLSEYDAAQKIFEQTHHRVHNSCDGIDPFVLGKIANLHADIARIYYSHGHVSKALEALDEALQLRQHFDDLRLQKAQILLEMKRYEEAIANLQLILNHRPEDAETLLLLGLCYIGQGEKAKALQQWQKISQNKPQYHRAQAYIRMSLKGLTP